MYQYVHTRVPSSDSHTFVHTANPFKHFVYKTIVCRVSAAASTFDNLGSAGVQF